MPEPTDRRRALLDIASVADRLGVTVRHIRRLVAERRIPFIKWGSILHFDPDEIDDWIDRHRRRPRPGLS
jgi:excisionase family DNA binding protein